MAFPWSWFDINHKIQNIITVKTEIIMIIITIIINNKYFFFELSFFVVGFKELPFWIGNGGADGWMWFCCNTESLYDDGSSIGNFGYILK